MKIFTKRGLEEELERRRKEQEEKEYVHKRLYELEEKIESLHRLLNDIILDNVEKRMEK